MKNATDQSLSLKLTKSFYKINCAIWLPYQNDDPAIKDKFKPLSEAQAHYASTSRRPSITKSILNLIQLE